MIFVYFSVPAPLGWQALLGGANANDAMLLMLKWIMITETGGEDAQVCGTQLTRVSTSSSGSMLDAITLTLLCSSLHDCSSALR